MGEQLIEELSLGTGLPQEVIRKEIKELVKSAGVSIDNLTLEDIRKIMANYLQDVLLEAKDEFSEE